MLNMEVFSLTAKLSVFAEDQTGGIPWWVILLLLAILTIVLIWALTRNAAQSEEDAPHVEHAPVEHKAEEIHLEPAAVVPDDLEIIEGIGPKIAGVLKAAGIQTFAQLAETEPGAITKILFDADPRLARLGDPTTWPEQAKLAAAGDQGGLQALQDSLKGGRKVN